MSSPPARPECTDKKVLSFIASARNVATLNSLQKFFRLSAEETKETLDPILDKLERAGKIIPTKGSGKNTKNIRYKPSEKEQISDLMVVRISRVEGGDVFVEPVKTGRATIPTMKIGTRDRKAFKSQDRIGDKLLVRIKDRSGWDEKNDKVTVQCLVEQELKHGAAGLLTGEVKRAADGELRFHPDLKGNTITFPFNTLKLPDMEAGDHLLVSICEDFDQAMRPVVEPVERVWRPGQPSSKIGLHVLSQNNVRLRMPDRIERAAERFAKTVKFSDYEDMRDLPLVTIDGRDANERDDAVGALPDNSPDNPGGYIMYTAIADASAFVPVGSSWDEMAMEEPFSKYAFGRSVDMLPQSIVHKHCSLNENTDRPAIVLERRMDRHGNLIQSNFKAGIINVMANLAYDRVDQALDPVNPRPFSSQLQRTIETYHAAAQIRHQFYLETKGMLEIDDRKVYPVFDQHGMVQEFAQETNSPSRADIKVGMIDMSILAGEVITDAGLSFMGRVHDDPDDDMIDRAADRLEALDITMRRSDEGWTPFDYSNAIRDASRPHQPMFLRNSVSHIILSAIKPARYEWEGEGHFGVATDGAYAKVTSPLRDYAQLINQRALKKSIGIYDGPIATFEDDDHGITEFEMRLNQKDYEATTIQRQALQAYAIESLMHQKGKKVAAQVMGLSQARGLSLRIDGCPVVFDMPTDGLELTKDRKGCINRISGQRTNFGSFIDVRIQKADPFKATIEIEFEINRQEARHKAQPGRASYKKGFSTNTKHLPHAKRHKARVLEASTKVGLRLAIETQKGVQEYIWPRSGYSFGAVNGGIRIFPNKKKNRSGMVFKEGEDVSVLVRQHRKSGEILAVEIPKKQGPMPEQDKKKKEIARLDNFAELGDHLPTPE